MNALEALFDAELKLGNHDAVIEEILHVLSEHSLHERFVEQCVLAMHRSNRVADALATYDRYRCQLADELGLDPGQAIQHLHRKVLTSDSSLDYRSSERSTSPRPAQLPADVAGFTGRWEQVDTLNEALGPHTDGGASRVVSIVGPAGSGKTSLAIHWAHRNRSHFIDGQLFVDLRGYGGDTPLTQDVVLERFLRALDVPADSIPADPDDRAATLRSTLAERRVLIVLDNASSAAQVRPLLPGAGACLTLVTSRSRLDGLVATHGTTRIELGALSLPEAVTLIEQSCGLADPHLTARLAELCGRLPLALRIATARLASTEQEPDHVLSELSDLRTRLTGLTADEEVSVRSTLDGSSQALTPALHRTFRLLALHPGPRMSVAACGTLAELKIDVAWDHLRSLAYIHLIRPDDDGHFVLHDLVKLYADELSRKNDSPDMRGDALRRILVWYRDKANAADRLLRPSERPNFPLSAEASFDTETEALAWLDAQSSTLIAAATSAGDSHPQLAWQIAAATYGWLMRRGQRSQWIELYERAAQWAAQAGDLSGQAMITGRLAIPHGMLNHTDQAAKACLTAHALRVKLGDRLGAATALLNLGAVYVNASRPEDAIFELQQAASLGQDLPGTTHFMTLVNSNMAEAQRLAGRPKLSIESFSKAIANAQGCLPDRDIAQLLIGSAGAHKDIGDYITAVKECERGHELARQAGDEVLAAEAHAELGRIFLSKRENNRARIYLEKALLVMEKLGHRSVPELRQLLDVQKHWQ